MAVKNKDGHWIDGKGDAIPAKYIDKIDKMRDKVVEQLHKEAVQVSKKLEALKKKAFAGVYGHMDKVLKECGMDIRTDKGNKTLSNFSNTIKVEIIRKNLLGFDERLDVAKKLIDQCIRKWSDGADEKLTLLVDDAFKVDKKGNLDRDRILGLRKIKIKDKDWMKAMDIISDSLKVENTRSYVRFLVRGKANTWTTVPLDIAVFPDDLEG